MLKRALRLLRNWASYEFSWRFLVLAAAAGAFLAAIVVEETWFRALSLLIGFSFVSVLLAQLNYRIDTATRRFAAPGSASSVADNDHPGEAREQYISRPFGSEAPIVTVVIPGKNEASFARDCVSSLRSQTLSNYEVIIVDDASTDSTLDELLEAIDGDARFRILTTLESIGPGLARNLGVANATTKYVTFLDLDDFLTPDSLESRIVLAEKHAHKPWVAGAYCWHLSVDVAANPRTWSPSGWARSGPISWLGHHDDNVFIVSAPVLRRDAFLAVGGFDDEPTAEDPILWFKMLRWGFTFVGTGQLGIAYRQKPSSRAVATTLEMRDAVSDLMRMRNASKRPPVGERGPFFYVEGIAEYRSMLGYVRRTASAMGLALADGASQAVTDGLVEDLMTADYPLIGWEVDIQGLAKAGARRVIQGNPELDPAPIEREIDRLLMPKVNEARLLATDWEAPTGHETSLLVDRVKARPVHSPILLSVTERSLQALTEGSRPFLLLPSASYHTDELIDLVPELRGRGFSPIAMLNNYRWETTGSALARVDVRSVTALEAGDWLFEFAGILTFNDWGEYYRDYVEYVAGSDTVSFAKVEGAQDWNDVDTGRSRNAYLASEVVLCQGQNDLEALRARRAGLHVVGSHRLERIWRDFVPRPDSPRVVANVNFTYGILTEHRQLWVETVLEACRAAQLPVDLSLHPSEEASYPGLAARAPMRHLLVESSILVSRFSTVLFEGMARGCSVVYYNPHGEEVPTFKKPQGAFDVANSPLELRDFLIEAKERSREEAKRRAHSFFASQVSMVDGVPVSLRTADVVERHAGARVI